MGWMKGTRHLMLLLAGLSLLNSVDLPAPAAHAQESAPMYCLTITPQDSKTRTLVNPTLGTVRPITTPATPTRVSTLGASPDRAWSVYTVRPDAEAGKPRYLSLMAESLTTGATLTLEADILSAAAVWSPDNTLLYVVWRPDGQPEVIMLRLAPNGERTILRQLTIGTPPNATLSLIGWSADGQWAAFVAPQGNVVRLHFWSAPDSRTVEMGIAWPVADLNAPTPAATSGEDAPPLEISGAWSPQGWWLALNGHGTLKLYQFDPLTITLTEQHHLDTRSQGSVDDVAQSLAWSADGRYVGRYTPGNFDSTFDTFRDLIDVVGIDGSTIADITQGGDYIAFGELEWLAMSASILLGKVITPGRYDIYAYDLPSRRYTLLVPAMELFYSGGFGPPSPNIGPLWLVTEAKEAASGPTFDIELFVRDERRRIAIVQGAADILLATFTPEPDQRLVAVWADAAGQVYVRLTDLAGQTIHEWTAAEWRFWLPWGFRLSVLTRNSGLTVLFLLQRTEGDIVETWVERVDLLTGERVILLNAGQVKQATNGEAMALHTLAAGIAPDGAAAAYTVRTGGEVGELVIVTGGKAHHLPLKPQVLLWSPDGRWLLTQRELSSSLSYPISKPVRAVEVLHGVGDKVGTTALTLEFTEPFIQATWVACGTD